MIYNATNAYMPPHLLRNAHMQTVIPALFRQVEVAYTRQRLTLPDGDFVDLDMAGSGSKRVALLLHGLEGSTDSAYVRGMTRALIARGWDVVALNMRGCSGEPNRMYQSYHSGATADPLFVLQWLRGEKKYEQAALVGFSLGGNITLKLLGEFEEATNLVTCAAAISVPCDLAASAAVLGQRGNYMYMKRFLWRLQKKIRQKAHAFPEHGITNHQISAMRNFLDVDNLYTAPAHGFKDAEDYWAQCSSVGFLDHIRVPTLLLQAADDPFLAPSCFPYQQAEHHAHLTLQVTERGGHVGFMQLWDDEYWHETRVANYLTTQAG